MKKKIEFYILKYFILIIVSLSLIGSTNFLKKIYFVNRDGYDSRIAKNYSFCKDESVAFLYFLKLKYELNKRVKIINYEIHPSSEWVFFNLINDNIYKDKLILLNYKKQDEIKFVKLKKGLFVGNVNPPYRSSIKKAILSTNNNINKISLEITNRAEDKTMLLLSKNFIFEDQSKEIDLNLDLEKFDIRLGKLFIKITNNENNLEHIEEITLKLTSSYNLNNFKVLEKIDNCYFLERLS
jgi:hypothetical protein